MDDTTDVGSERRGGTVAPQVSDLEASRRLLAGQIALLSDLQASDTLVREGLEQALAEAARGLSAAAGLDRTGIWLAEPSDRPAQCVVFHLAATGQTLVRPGIAMQADEWHEFREALGRQGVIVSADLAADPPPFAVMRRHLAQVELSAYMVLPVWRGESIVGAVTAAHTSGPHDWRDEEGSLIAAVANHVAVLVERRDRLAVEARLASRERFYRVLIESTRDGLCLVDADMRVRYASPRVLENAGVDAASMLGTDVTDYVAAEDRPVMRSLIAHARYDRFSRCVYRTVGPRDAARWVEVFARRMSEPPNEGLVLLASRDITRLEEQKYALAQSERRYRDIVEGTIQAIAISRDGILLYVNAVLARLLGVPQESLIGRSAQEFVPTVEQPRMRRYHEQVQGSDGRVLHAERRFLRGDGTQGWLETQSVLIDWQGEPAILTSAYDVSERKAAEEALADSERRFRDLVEGSIQGIFIHDGERLLYANKAFADMLGASVQELEGAPAENLVDPQERARLRQIAQRRFDGEAPPSRYQTRLVRRDGRVVWVELLARVVAWQGRRAIQGAVIDITEQRLAEEQLRQSQKMEAIGNLTGGVAHDFNNILAVMIGNLDLLREKGGLSAEQERMVAQVLDAAMRGADLTRSLLAYSRRQQLVPERVDLNEMSERTAGLLRRTLGEDIEIVARRAPGAAEAMVDPAQLQAALINLALNARDAMPDGGRIDIATGATVATSLETGRPDSLPPGRYATVAVRDRGRGIAPELIDRIFEPFFTTKDVGRGTGLGLSMVYGFARQSGGFVTVTSVPGQGTTVRLAFPVPPAEMAAPPAAERDHGGLTVLVVEDEPEVLAIVCGQLEGLGHRTLRAQSADAALAILERESGVQLLLTDMLLADGERGTSLARVARRLRPGLPVVVMTGYAGDSVGMEADLVGVPVLSKPFRRSDLVPVLRRAVPTA